MNRDFNIQDISSYEIFEEIFMTSKPFYAMPDNFGIYTLFTFAVATESFPDVIFLC